MDTPIDLLEWDSRHFGLKVARLREPSGRAHIEDGIAAAELAGVRCLVALIDLDQTAAFAAAEEAGFRCYDVRLELDRQLDGSAPVEPIAASEGDLPRLEEIARASFTDSRFYADPNFDDELAADMYALWVRRGIADAGRLLLTTEDREGFVVCHLDAEGGTGAIELIGVADGASGRGLGTRLLAEADSAFATAGLSRARVITQARNIAAQRLYQRWGYRTAKASAWLHRWAG